MAEPTAACAAFSCALIDLFALGISNRMQRRHSTFLRVMAGVHPGVPTRTLLAEFGQRPLQYQWWKGVLSFWNDSVANQNSPLLKLVLGSDAKLADDGCTTNWTAEVRSALRSMEYQGPIPSRSLLPLPLDEIMDHWHQRFTLVLGPVPS